MQDPTTPSVRLRPRRPTGWTWIARGSGGARRAVPSLLRPRIASLEWDTAELKSLHHSSSHEMKRETAAILSWPTPSPLLERTA